MPARNPLGEYSVIRGTGSGTGTSGQAYPAAGILVTVPAARRVHDAMVYHKGGGFVLIVKDTMPRTDNTFHFGVFGVVTGVSGAFAGLTEATAASTVFSGQPYDYIALVE
jgi:hypothetical protein